MLQNIYISILKQRGYKVYLTRSKDIFIKVMERTVLANEKCWLVYVNTYKCCS